MCKTMCYDRARTLAESQAKTFSVARMERVSAEQSDRRRSLRIVMRVPLYVSPANAPASAEWEPVETLVVSMHGGMIRTRQKFPVGTTLDIRMRNAQKSTRGRVVWTSVGTRDRPFDVGFELLEPPGFWGIKFPENKWSEGERAAFRRT